MKKTKKYWYNKGTKRPDNEHLERERKDAGAFFEAKG
jgi:hypothetical protein